MADQLWGARDVARAYRETRGVTTVEQEFAPRPMAAYEKVQPRAFSSLRLISDAAFAEGLARYEAWCRTASVAPLIEPLDLIVFGSVCGGRPARATAGSD